MDGEAAGGTRAVVTDLVELVAKALLSGIGVAVAMSVAILALSTGAQAASPNDARTGTLLLRGEAAGDLAPAPTVETQVAIEVTGMIGRIRVSQVFHNPGKDFVEGVYVFPLPGNAAVDHLWMRIGAREIEGRIQEKEEARRTYERARREGRKAALVEQLRPNLFTNTVAHIGPGEYVRITIEYQQPIGYDAGVYSLRFPLAVTPRYVPMGYRDDPEEAWLPDGCGGGALNSVDIVALIDAGMPLAKVDSSYHDITIEKTATGHRTTVMLTRDQEFADRDFELAWTVASGVLPQAALFTQRGADDMVHALVMVMPPQPGAAETAAFQRQPRETILIADTSGSMQGASMAQAKLALEHALSTLTPRDRFNVVEFNSVTRPMWPDALPATPQNVGYAREWVRKLKAGGGTEMMPALAFALNAGETPGFLRQVIFMTDGGVANEEGLFRMIVERLGASRLFTIGIGSAPNGNFMAKAAQFGRGTFTQIGDVREVQEKMTRLFARIEAPVLRDVAIRFADGTAVETFPARIPDLYLGEPLMVSAARVGAIGTLVVSGVRGNEPWSVALTPSPDVDSAGVGALWARARIASLMDEVTRGVDPAVIRPQVVKIALAHHLVSAYTSLVAADVVQATLSRASLDLPQTATPAALQFVLGLLALTSAGILAAFGRHAGDRA